MDALGEQGAEEQQHGAFTWVRQNYADALTVLPRQQPYDVERDFEPLSRAVRSGPRDSAPDAPEEAADEDDEADEQPQPHDNKPCPWLRV